MKPEYRYVDKQVPVMQTKGIQRVVEVPFVLEEERAVFVPQVQLAERMREQLIPQVKQVEKEVARVQIEYVDKVLVSDPSVQNPFGETPFGEAPEKAQLEELPEYLKGSAKSV